MTKFLQVFIMVAAVIIVLVAAAVVVASLWNADPNVRSALVAAIGMFVVGIWSHRQIKKREIDARHFADKRDAYMKFMDLFFNLMKGQRLKKPTKDSRLVEDLSTIKKHLMVWSGPEMLDAWEQFESETQAAASTSDPKEVLMRFDSLLRAIRKDLGHNDTLLAPGALVSMILKSEDKMKL